MRHEQQRRDVGWAVATGEDAQSRPGDARMERRRGPDQRDTVRVSGRTIYVELLDEGIDVWRPVEPVEEVGGVYRMPVWQSFLAHDVGLWLAAVLTPTGGGFIVMGLTSVARPALQGFGKGGRH